MPWESKDAPSHTKEADTAKKKRQWSHVANAALGKGASESSAIKQANAVVGGFAKHRGHHKRRRVGSAHPGTRKATRHLRRADYNKETRAG